MKRINIVSSFLLTDFNPCLTVNAVKQPDLNTFLAIVAWWFASANAG